jgi:phosphatidylglycerophosphatase A
MIKKIIFLFVTLFNIGKISRIPGSIASLVTIFFLFFLFHILKIPANFILLFVIIIFFISLYAVNVFIKNLDNKDPKEVVIDEFIGQSIPICLYEIAHEGTNETLSFLLRSNLTNF